MSRSDDGESGEIADAEAAGSGDFDTPALLAMVGRLANQRVLKVLRDNGFPDIRERDGYVVQHLVAGGRGITDLARRMGVSQQAASKRVQELTVHGYLRRSPSPSDGRLTLVHLTGRGRAVVRASREARAALDAELQRLLGADHDVLRQNLAAIIGLLDPEGTIAARRVPED